MAFRKITLWVLLIVLLLAMVLAYPAYRQIRVWRAESMAAEAETLLATPETLSRAWELAHAANALLPDDPEIARTLARVYVASDPAAAVRYWQNVIELSNGAG